MPSATRSSANKQIGLAAPVLEEAAAPQFAIERDDGDKHDADGGEMRQLRQVVEPVGIDQGRDVGKRFVALMVIEHDHVHAELFRLGQRLDAGGAAIDGDEQRRAAPGERPYRLGIGAIAFEQPVGNVDQRIQSAMPQIARKQGRRGCAVHVVIAENRDVFAALDRVGQPRRRRLHGGERMRIGHQVAHRRIEIALDLVHLDPAAGKDARQQFGRAVTLRDGERPRGGALVQAVAPGAAADGLLDAEEQARRRLRRYGQSGHACDSQC